MNSNIIFYISVSSMKMYNEYVSKKSIRPWKSVVMVYCAE